MVGGGVGRREVGESSVGVAEEEGEGFGERGRRRGKEREEGSESREGDGNGGFVAGSFRVRSVDLGDLGAGVQFGRGVPVDTVGIDQEDI